MDSTPNESLIFACLLDGHGGAEFLDWQGLEQNWTNEKLVWAHLNYVAPETERWLEEKSAINEIIGEFLTNEETRPTCFVSGDGLLLIVRGVNYSRGAEIEDLASLRLWIADNRIASFRLSQSLVVEDLLDPLKRGCGITRAGEFLVELLDRVLTRMRSLINDLEDQLDRLEEDTLVDEHPMARTKLTALRRQVIGLRRHLYPQSEVFQKLPLMKLSWLTDDDRIDLRQLYERQMRYVEELDFIRERTSILQEEMISHVSEHINNRMYFISLVACIFLPLTLLTGLLGANVGGIPGSEDPHGFRNLCLLLGAITVGIATFMKLRKLM